MVRGKHADYDSSAVPCATQGKISLVIPAPEIAGPHRFKGQHGPHRCSDAKLASPLEFTNIGAQADTARRRYTLAGVNFSGPARLFCLGLVLARVMPKFAMARQWIAGISVRLWQGVLRGSLRGQCFYYAMHSRLSACGGGFPR